MTQIQKWSALVLFSLALSAPASAANRYLYFSLGDNQIVSLPMEEAYSRIKKKNDTLMCAYMRNDGATAEFSLDPPHCPGDETTTLSLDITVPAGEGHHFHASSYGAFVDHASVYLESSVDGPTPAGFAAFNMAVMSATNYRKLGDVMPMDRVPSIALGSGKSSVPGTLSCWMTHMEAQCQR